MATTVTTYEQKEAQRQEELRCARIEKSNYEKNLNDSKNQYSTNEGRIERLKTVKKNLANQKRYATSRYNSLKEYSEDIAALGDWNGVMKVDALNTLNNDILSQYSLYVNQIDVSLDSVCDEITRLENTNMQLHGDILRIRTLINNIVDAIEKLCN